MSPESNEAFFREVDEEMRREQFASFGRRYGVWVAIAIVVVIAAVGGWLYWMHAKNAKASEAGIQYNAAIDALGKENVDAAGKQLQPLTASKIDGYRAMSRFVQADVLLRNDDAKGAAKKFAEIANDDALPQPYRDLAIIRQTLVQYDDMKPQDVIQRLRPLAMKESPWFGSAGEMVAIAYMRSGRRDLASKMYSDLAASDDIPDSVRQRAVQMAGALGTDTDKAAGNGKTGDKNAKDTKAG
nr:tetratricopeptide repeat protein [Stakelama flava]